LFFSYKDYNMSISVSQLALHRSGTGLAENYGSAGKSHLRRSVLETGLSAALIVLGILAYTNSFSGPFIFDDEESILKNPYIVHLWPLTKALSAPRESTVAGRPVAGLSLALNYAISGYEVWSYHLFNLAVHILAGLTLYGIVRRTLLSNKLREKFGKHSAVLAWAAAAIWLVHPLQTESVTYIVQRTESLMGLFYLLTLYCAIRAMQGTRPLVWSVFSVLCCGLGMGTKEVMVTAPVLVLLYDRIFSADTFSEALRRRRGLYIALAATWVIPAALIWSGSRSASIGFSFGIRPLDYALNQSVVILHYLRLAFWPSGLCINYGWPIIKDWAKIAPAVLAVLGMLALTVWGLVRGRPWSYPAAWFFGVLAPTSSFVPIADLAFEHRMYLPLAGLTVSVVLFGYTLSGALSKKFLPVGRFVNRAGVVLVLIVVAVLIVATFSRNRDYYSDVSLWQTALDVMPANPRALNNLGRAFQTQGKHDEAITRFSRALELLPNYPDTLYNLAVSFQAQGKLDQAITNYRLAIQARPDYADAHYNLAAALDAWGKSDEAAEHYRQVLRISPNDAAAHNNLGVLLNAAGKPDEAISHYLKALSADPNYAQAHNNLAAALVSQDKLDEAVTHYRRALAIEPNYPKAHYNLGIALQRQDRFDEALGHYCQAVRLKPDYSDALRNAVKILVSHPQTATLAGQIVALAERAAEVTARKDPAVLDMLAAAYAVSGRFDSALSTARTALSLASAAGDANMTARLTEEIKIYSKKTKDPNSPL
jgi:tetratricopeptide (TPR) repeat protein